jgi:hypothetical protein
MGSQGWRVISSAEGEGRSTRSLRYQFEIVATRVYDALLQGTLDRVWLGDEQAGAADDAVMRVAGHVLGFSAKYDDAVGNFTYRDLTDQDETGRSLIRDLFSGFRALSGRYDPTGLSVVLVTNQPANVRTG